MYGVRFEQTNKHMFCFICCVYKNMETHETYECMYVVN